MAKGITCHITFRGRPVCTMSSYHWRKRFMDLPQQCEYGSLMQANMIRRSMQKAWEKFDKEGIKVVRGYCPEVATLDDQMWDDSNMHMKGDQS